VTFNDSEVYKILLESEEYILEIYIELKKKRNKPIRPIIWSGRFVLLNEMVLENKRLILYRDKCSERRVVVI